VTCSLAFAEALAQAGARIVSQKKYYAVTPIQGLFFLFIMC
jgi:hypothetical protein